jgi:hypothetical protein
MSVGFANRDAQLATPFSLITPPAMQHAFDQWRSWVIRDRFIPRQWAPMSAIVPIATEFCDTAK